MRLTVRICPITAETGELTSGWYYVPSNANISRGTITVNGTVNLILEDGGSLTATGGWELAGIGVSVTNSLTIYGQQNGTGSVTAKGGNDGAGIGGGEGGSGGTITINGGTVTAKGDNTGAGIGGGYMGAGGTITINGGTVTAKGDITGAGIGGGEGGSGGTITINGGTVNAKGGTNGVGIGGSATAGTFSTGENGSAFIVANSISDKNNQSAWSGIIFDGNNGKVYGTPTLKTSVEIPAGMTLTIEDGKTLPVANGAALSNSGTINIQSGGTINNAATMTNNGFITIRNGGTLSNAGTISNKGSIYQFPGGQFTGTEVQDNQIITEWESIEVCGFNVIGGSFGEDYSLIDDALTILSDAPLTIKNIDSSTPNANPIKVVEGVNANITLNGVNVEASGNALDLNKGGICTITLEKGSLNTLKCNDQGSGILAPERPEGSDAKLIIQGDGELKALGPDWFPGICGNGGRVIEIRGGVIYSAGISSHIGPSAGAGAATVIITGGSVKTGNTDISAIVNAPVNSEDAPVYLGKLAEQSSVTDVSIDGTPYYIAQNHTSDTALYLYMTGENHSIQVKKGGTVYTYNATYVSGGVDGDAAKGYFTFAAAGAGTTPSRETSVAFEESGYTAPYATPAVEVKLTISEAITKNTGLRSVAMNEMAFTLKDTADTTIWTGSGAVPNNATTYTFNVPTAKLELGAYTLKAEYGGSATDKPAEPATTTLTITKAEPVLTVTASAINYGETLSQSSLSTSTATNVAGDTVAGTFSWQSDAGTVKPIMADSGITNYSVTFTPTDTTNYAAVTKNDVTLTVNKRKLTPSISVEGVIKPYDGNTTIVGTQPTLSLFGSLSGEPPVVTATYAYVDASIGGNKTIVAKVSLTSAPVNVNYELTSTVVRQNGGEITPLPAVTTAAGLAKALGGESAAVANGDTVTLLEDATLIATIVIADGNLTLNLGGHTITGAAGTNGGSGAAALKINGGSLTIAGNGTITGGADVYGGLYNGYGGHGVDGDVTVSGGTVVFTGGAGGYINSSYGGFGGCGVLGNVTITGGTATFTGGAGGGSDRDTGGAGGSGIYGNVTVYGGAATFAGGAGGESNRSKGGGGGRGVDGNVTVSGGTASFIGGAGGFSNIYHGNGGDGIYGDVTISSGMATFTGGASDVSDKTGKGIIGNIPLTNDALVVTESDDNSSFTKVTASEGAYSSTKQYVKAVIPSAPAPPIGVVGVACTTPANNDGKLTGVSNLMEYKSAADTSYTAIEGAEVTGLASGSYLVRFKETTDSLVSADVAVTVGAYIDTDKIALLEAKTAIEAALDHLTVSNATTAQEVLAVASDVATGGVAVAWDIAFAKTNATATVSGNITGTLKLTLNGKIETVEVRKVIPLLPVVTYTVALDANSGIVSPASLSVTAGGTVALPTPTRASGYRFDGWFTALSGGVQYTSATPINANVTLYARWTYIDGGSSGSGGGGNSTGGSGSGGSSNSSNSNNHVTITTDPTKPNAPTTGEITSGKPDKNGNAKVPSGQITSAIDKTAKDAKKNGNIENGIAITVKLPDGATSASLDRTALDQLIATNVTGLTLDSQNTMLTFDLPALKEIAAKTIGIITFGANKATGLTGDALETIGTRPAYKLTVTYQSGGKTMDITDFGTGSVSVTLDYTPTAQEQDGALHAVYVDDSGKVQWLDQSGYDQNAKAVRFATNHFSVFGIGYKPTLTFTDVATHWAKDDIAFVVRHGILTGTDKTTFSPNNSMTRGMFVTALGRLDDADISGYKQSSFNDVSATAYYMGYVEWASKNGIVNGIGGGAFAPDQSINREQMAVILVNYAKTIGFPLPKVHEQNTFADSDSISEYAKDAVTQMQMAGVLSGKSGNQFDPQGTATRGEVSTMLRRFIALTIGSDTAES